MCPEASPRGCTNSSPPCPTVSFEVVHIGAKRCPSHKLKYAVPDNVRSIHDIFLENDLPKTKTRRGRAGRDRRLALAEAARRCLVEEKTSLKTLLLEFLELGDGFTFHDVWTDPGMWDVFNELYEKLMPEESFKDFFWTARAVLRPVWNVLRACGQIETPKVFFTACTGYAGMLASIFRTSAASVSSSANTASTCGSG